jgi:hypothetical protein
VKTLIREKKNIQVLMNMMIKIRRRKIIIKKKLILQKEKVKKEK